MSFLIDDYTIAAGQHLPIEEMGNYFVIMDADAPVTVTIKQNRNPIGVANNVTFGFAFGPTKTPYTGVSIYSATTQTLKLAFTDDPVLYQKLVGEVTLAGTLPAFAVEPQIAGITDPLTPVVMPTTHYFRLGVSSALNTILAPAANVNGVIITSASAIVDVLNNVGVRCMAKTSAPSSYMDLAAITVFQQSNTASLQDYMKSDMPLPIKIPAGYGLYEQSTSAAYNSGIELNYEVL